jgi:hypothetical protein
MSVSDHYTDDEYRLYMAGVATRALGGDSNYWQEFARAWGDGENTTAAWNPLATTQKMRGSTPFNSAGVQNYPDAATGIEATAITLNPTLWGGIDYYPSIRAAIAAQNIDAVGRSEVAAEVRKWGTTGFAAEIDSGADFGVIVPVPIPAPIDDPSALPDTPAQDDDDVLRAALIERFYIARLAWLDDSIVVAAAARMLKTAGIIA